MGKLLELSNRLRQLTPQRLEAEVLVILNKNEQVFTDMNADQLYQGEDAKGNKLPDYSERSVTVFGKPNGPMRLYETGSFYRGLFLDTSKFPVIVFSSDQKTGKIADLLASRGHNPDDIYGLQKPNLKDFSRSYVLPDLQKFIRDFIHV